MERWQEDTQAETAAITYTKGKFRNRVICKYVNSAAEDSDEDEDVHGQSELQHGNQVLFVQFGTKQMLDKMLSDASFGDHQHELVDCDARVLENQKGAFDYESLQSCPILL